MTEIDYRNQEDHYFSKSDLVLRSMVEHTLYFIHLSDTEKAKEELSKRRFRYIQTVMELFESLVEYYIIMSDETDDARHKAIKLEKHGKLVNQQYANFFAAFYNLKDGYYNDDMLEKLSKRNEAMRDLFLTMKSDIAEFVMKQGGNRLQKVLNLLVLVYDYCRLGYENALKNIGLELSYDFVQKIERIEQFISENRGVCIKEVNINDVIRNLKIKLI